MTQAGKLKKDVGSCNFEGDDTDCVNTCVSELSQADDLLQLESSAVGQLAG